jgi:single-strand DNA-binding protein
MNKTILTGNVGKDAEIKTSSDGRQFAVFNVANTEKTKDSEITNWYSCFIQNERMLQSTLVSYIKKGTKVLIEGKLSARIWTKQDGTTEVNYIINVNNLELMGGGERREITPPIATEQPIQQPQVSTPTIEADEDDLPF